MKQEGVRGAGVETYLVKFVAGHEIKASTVLLYNNPSSASAEAAVFAASPPQASHNAVPAQELRNAGLRCTVLQVQASASYFYILQHGKQHKDTGNMQHNMQRIAKHRNKGGNYNRGHGRLQAQLLLQKHAYTTTRKKTNSKATKKAKHREERIEKDREGWEQWHPARAAARHGPVCLELRVRLRLKAGSAG